MRNKNEYTPMMQQYLTIKENYQDAFVFFRLGDFYELFFEDAQLASKELEIALTGREAGTAEARPYVWSTSSFRRYLYEPPH